MIEKSEYQIEWAKTCQLLEPLNFIIIITAVEKNHKRIGIPNKKFHLPFPPLCITQKAKNKFKFSFYQISFGKKQKKKLSKVHPKQMKNFYDKLSQTNNNENIKNIFLFKLFVICNYD